MKKFYSQGGVTLPDKYLQREIDTRPTFTRSEQIKLFDRSKGLAIVDGWYHNLGEYLMSTGTIASVPDTKTFITDEYLTRVQRDLKLWAFAEGR